MKKVLKTLLIVFAITILSVVASVFVATARGYNYDIVEVGGHEYIIFNTTNGSSAIHNEACPSLNHN